MRWYLLASESNPRGDALIALDLYQLEREGQSSRPPLEQRLEAPHEAPGINPLVAGLWGSLGEGYRVMGDI